MGLFDVFNDIAKQVKRGVTGAIDTVKSTFNKVEPKIESAATSVFGKAEKITNTLYGDAKGAVNFFADQYAKNADAAREVVTDISGGSKDLLTGAGKGVEGLGEGLGNALPYIGVGLAVVAAAYAYANSGEKRSRQNQRISVKNFGKKAKFV